MKVNIDQLNNSTLKAKNGKLWKYTVADYYLHISHYNYILKRQINCGSYKPRPCSNFTITEPKVREITAPHFRDRIIQKHANNRYVKPKMSKVFIKENCACQVGKGTDYARNIFKDNYRRFFARYRDNRGFVLKIDIHHFFPSIDGNIVDSQLHKYFKDDVCRFLEMWGVQKGQKGLGLGCETNQYLSLTNLHPVDTFCKTVKSCRYYARYQDDIIVLLRTKEEAKLILDAVRMELSKLTLELNEKKTKIIRMSDWVNFLGFNFRMTETGKVLMEISYEKIHRELRRLRKQKKILSQKELTACARAWFAYASKASNIQTLARTRSKVYAIIAA